MFSISDHVSFPRVSFLCPTVVHEKTHEFGYNSNKESYSLGNDTWSEMGKHCHATEKVYLQSNYLKREHLELIMTSLLDS